MDRGLLHGDCLTVTGKTVAENLAGVSVDLKGQATRFVAMIGIDDAIKQEGSVTYEIWVDNKKKLITDVMRAGSKPLSRTSCAFSASPVTTMCAVARS